MHLLLTALEDLLKDPSFHTGTQVAAGALQAAEILYKWCSLAENQIKLKLFAEKLEGYLENCFKSTVKSTGSTIICRDKLWRSFFLVRSSSDFISHWTMFLNNIILLPTPTLYQHLRLPISLSY